MGTHSIFNFYRIVSQGASTITEHSARPARQPIYVNVIFHKDLGHVTEREFEQTHLALAKKHIEEISGREVVINVIRDPKIRDFAYKSDNDVERGLHEHLSRNGNPGRDRQAGKPKIEKTLFVTPNTSSFREPAKADPSHTYGITSYNNPRGAAHALGLLLGATREDGAITYNGWWNDTFMKYNGESLLRGNDLNYSDANKQNIRKYLDKFD
ncbi:MULTISPECIES: hypothetical protein [unclassified Pseudomonas]|jgi:hypothetical protein|uniref:hypothetical protein n=1 Tax=unclassified Pseudomonas TaxID=196821 RepID=UPI0008B7DC7D|nr:MULTISPECIES: hypothetical protein [unclassified Pseudomonas]SES99903.1 hypothetical protein SAMN03159512_00990 [Pseudomonas sp. NFR09]SFH92206.1 hypothetical protein SAMN03159342_00949 [Pseudomonas sp. NFPP04]SFJ28913.1 hypothetical protein SAMN03159344_03080 [Pseudomonas sp. NFPP11]